MKNVQIRGSNVNIQEKYEENTSILMLKKKIQAKMVVDISKIEIKYKSMVVDNDTLLKDLNTNHIYLRCNIIKPSVKRKLCAGDCGFYGDPEYCSLCMKNSSNSISETEEEKIPDLKEYPGILENEEQLRKDIEHCEKLQNTSNSMIGKCWECKKKVGIYGFKCKCELLFCMKHRLPFSHKCTFDFKTIEMEQLKKNNQQLESNKIQKI